MDLLSEDKIERIFKNQKIFISLETANVYLVLENMSNTRSQEMNMKMILFKWNKILCLERKNDLYQAVLIITLIALLNQQSATHY